MCRPSHVYLDRRDHVLFFLVLFLPLVQAALAPPSSRRLAGAGGQRVEVRPSAYENQDHGASALLVEPSQNLLSAKAIFPGVVGDDSVPPNGPVEEGGCCLLPALWTLSSVLFAFLHSLIVESGMIRRIARFIVCGAFFFMSTC